MKDVIERNIEIISIGIFLMLDLFLTGIALQYSFSTKQAIAPQIPVYMVTLFFDFEVFQTILISKSLLLYFSAVEFGKYIKESRRAAPDTGKSK